MNHFTSIFSPRHHAMQTQAGSTLAPIAFVRDLKIGLAATALMFASAAFAQTSAPASPAASTNPNASPIYGVTIPDGYRKWQFIAPAHETAPLDELRVVLGNPAAIAAVEKNQLPFPDGTVLVKLAWKHVQSKEFAPAYVPGKATTVQVMVKDSKKYAATGGWGFGRFIDGKPVDIAQHQTCFACHQALVKNNDYVFTRLAP